MASIVAIVSALSARLVANLAAKGYPALAAGKIQLGRARQQEIWAPPRIMMVPVRSAWGGAQAYSRQPQQSSAENKAQRAQRSIATELISFEVRCWGAQPDRVTSPETVPDDDYDFTQTLYHAFIQAACAPTDDGDPAILGPLTSGGVELSPGAWTDATHQSAQVLLAGREFVFGLQASIPVTDSLATFAPSDVTQQTNTFLTTPNGGTPPAPSQGCGP